MPKTRLGMSVQEVVRRIAAMQEDLDRILEAPMGMAVWYTPDKAPKGPGVHWIWAPFVYGKGQARLALYNGGEWFSIDGTGSKVTEFVEKWTPLDPPAPPKGVS